MTRAEPPSLHRWSVADARLTPNNKGLPSNDKASVEAGRISDSHRLLYKDINLRNRSSSDSACGFAEVGRRQGADEMHSIARHSGGRKNDEHSEDHVSNT